LPHVIKTDFPATSGIRVVAPSSFDGLELKATLLFKQAIKRGCPVKMRLTTERAQLDGLMIFIAVAEQRGFRAAARRLALTPSAVSQSIRALEIRIGAPLFSRTTRSVSLTEAGERLMTHARPAVEMLKAGLDAASGIGGEISGKLRINAPRPSLPLLANRLFPEFFDRHPNVQIELIGDDQLVDIVGEGFDAGIRLGHLVQADMVAVRLTPAEKFVVVGTPAFFRRNGKPSHPNDLQDFKCIQLQHSARSIRWEFRIDSQIMRVAVQGPLIVNDVEMCIRSALRGVGLFQTPRSLVLSYMDKGELGTVLDRFSVEVPGLVLYYPSRSQSLPKLKAFAKFAAKQLKRAYDATDFLPKASLD
jgi:DNA-binding transcriptional LysR family regulator